MSFRYDHRMPMAKYEFQYRNLYAKYSGGTNSNVYYDDANTFVTNSGVIGRQLERPHSEPEGSIEDDFDEEIPDDG
jgi:hypothetical protein